MTSLGLYQSGDVNIPSPIVYFAIDSGASNHSPQPNVFVTTGQGNSPGGLGGLGFLSGAGGQLAQIINSVSILSVSYLIPRSGSGYFYTPDGTWSQIAGALDIQGSGLDNATVSGDYKANFTGSYLGSVTCD